MQNPHPTRADGIEVHGTAAELAAADGRKQYAGDVLNGYSVTARRGQN